VTRNAAAGVERVLPGATRIGPAHGHPGGRRRETEGQRMRESRSKGEPLSRTLASARRLLHMICYLWC